MDLQNRDDFKNLIKKERTAWFPTPFETIYQQLIKNNYHKQSHDYFVKNASFIVNQLRSDAWSFFLPVEEKFTNMMLQKLVNPDEISHLSGFDAVTYFVGKYPNHFYDISLSNTQSRRSRAGNEFEAIIELLLIGANIPMESQGNIGKTVFVQKGLGKMVDVVSPGTVEYIANKRNTVLISAKTTLRERWQEVPEEMGRTGAREMFLATLDGSISNEVLENLYNANIQIVTTKFVKQSTYSDNNSVLDFEELLAILADTCSKWDDYTFTADEIKTKLDLLQKQIEKYDNHDFIKNYYIRQKEQLLQ